MSSVPETQRDPLPAVVIAREHRAQISGKALTASRVRMIGTLASKVIGLGLNLILFRLLAPEDFGFFTAAIVVTGLASTISNFGLQAFLIQEPKVDDRTRSTTFFLDLALGAVMCSVLVVGAYLFQNKLRSPVVAQVIALYGLNMIALSVCRTPQALLKRELDFTHVTWGEIGYTVISMSCQVVLAAGGLGAICFPVGDIIGNTAKAIYLWFYAGFRPLLRSCQWEQAKRIVRFGGLTMFASMGGYFANQTDKLLVVSRFSAVTAGLYNFGYTQSALVYNLIVAPQSDVVFSLYSRMRSDPPALRQMVLRMIRAANFLVLPVYTFAFAMAPLIIEVVYGAKWLGATMVFRIFCLDYMLRSFFTNITGLQLAFGLAGEAARTKLFNGAVYVIVLALCSFAGDPIAYAWGYLGATSIVAVHNTKRNGRLIHLSLLELLKVSVTNTAIVLVCVGIVVLLQMALAGVPAFLRLCLLGGAFLASYLGLAWWLVPSTIADVKLFVAGRKTRRKET